MVIILWPMVFCYGQGEPFSLSVINTKSTTFRLAHPFEITYAYDDHLYITEKIGRIVRVDPNTGIRQIILDIQSRVYLTINRNGSSPFAATSIGQDGMMGMALHPQFGQGAGKDSIYVAYSNVFGSVRISAFKYFGFTTGSTADDTCGRSNEVILIAGIPSGNDHSSGRLIVGGDNKLYYSCGDLGNNQFGNTCQFIRSQNAPTAAEISAQNYYNYSGKTLRINLNGSIPSDNPLFSGVRSHVFTMGHRNPQGLVWQKNASNGYSYPTLAGSGKLFSSEHGPRTDDEINILESGKNYGWPYIAGDSDNINYQYVVEASSGSCNAGSYNENYIAPGATIYQETQAPASVKSNFRKPMKMLYEDCGSLPSSVCDAGGTNWMKFATIAPSSIDYYNVNAGTGIPNWYPSLLIPTLRKGTLYRVKLNAAQDNIVGDTIPYFFGNDRYRDVAMNPAGTKIYLITDSIGTTSGPSGTGTSSLTHRGAILEYSFTGSGLPLTEADSIALNAKKYKVDVWPNPATERINVKFEKGVHKPVQYQLYDVAGKLVMDGRVNKDDFFLPVRNLHRGVYILKLYNGYGVEVKIEKIVLQ